MFSIDQIMKMRSPFELFDEDMEEAKIQYVELLKYYHPELNGQREENNLVTKKIKELYKEAKKEVKSGIIIKPGFIKIKSNEGINYETQYRIKHNFELGNFYICDKSIIYLVNEGNEDLVDNALNILKKFKYGSNEIKNEFGKYIPKVINSFKTMNNKLVVIIEKDKDLILLKDLLNYYDGKLSPRVTTLILNSLYNLVCFIHHNGISNNSITEENYFVSINNFRSALLGGWWYALSKDNRNIGFNKVNSGKDIIKNSNIYGVALDLDYIKSLGKTLLGDKTGIILAINNEIPLSLKNWLREWGGNDPFEEHRKWREVVRKNYGEEEHTNFKLDIDEFYKKLGGF